MIYANCPINKSHPVMQACRGMWVAGPVHLTGGKYHDLSGFRKHGTLINHAAFSGMSPPGTQLGSVWMDGSDDYINLGSNDLATGSQSRTVMVMSRITSSTSRYFSLGDISTGQAWRLWSNSGSLRIEIQGSGYTSSLSVPTNKWSVCGCRFQGTQLQHNELYLDGKFESATGTNSINTSSAGAVIGDRESTQPNNPLVGNVAAVMFWRRKLAKSEMEFVRNDMLLGFPTLIRWIHSYSFGVTSGGGGFQTAWAVGSTQTICANGAVVG